MHDEDAALLIVTLTEIRNILANIDDSLEHNTGDDLWLNVYIAAIGGQDLYKHSPEEIVRHAAAIADAACNIKCPQCGMVSHNRNDVERRYCGKCHQFHADMQR